MLAANQDDDFFARFLALARFNLASFFRRSSFETVRTMRRALLNFCPGVSPGTVGAGSGFIWSHHTAISRFDPMAMSRLRRGFLKIPWRRKRMGLMSSRRDRKIRFVCTP